jgi:hypothetical protein
VSFWRFAGAIMIGNAAALGTGWLASKALAREPAQTQQTAERIAGIAGFWIGGGVAWILLTRRPTS